MGLLATYPNVFAGTRSSLAFPMRALRRSLKPDRMRGARLPHPRQTSITHEIIASEKGAVVKTISDAVMATFETPDHAIASGLGKELRRETEVTALSEGCAGFSTS